jgi:DNA-directed RNA polymerase subunit D
MTLTIMEQSDNYIRFKVTDISPAEANALRRTIISDIPKLAIDKVTFHHGQIRDEEGNEYDSSLPLFDEVVAQRLSMIPIKSDLKMNFRDNCTCGGKGCSLCTATFSINKLGPATLYSGDLISVGGTVSKPTDPEIPILKLGPKQAILVSAEAVLGTAASHAKWQVATGVSYKYSRKFIVQKKSSIDYEKIKQQCPSSLVSESNTTITFTDDVPCHALTPLFENKECKIEEDSSSYIFQFETDGSLSALDVLDYALKRLPQRLNILLESLVDSE